MVNERPSGVTANVDDFNSWSVSFETRDRLVDLERS